VYTYNTLKDEGWVSVSAGITYNKLSDFNKNMTIVAKNPNSSLLDNFTMNANANPNNLSPTYEQLALETGAIYYDNDTTGGRIPSNSYLNDLQRYGRKELQQHMVSTKGSIGEYAFSFGANYSHKFYIGATFGIQDVYYEEIQNHTETNILGDYLKSFAFNQNFNITGTGYNLKVGIIYRPIDEVRLGLAFHTPTFYNLHSEFTTDMNTTFANAATLNATSPTYDYDYYVTTPMKTILSAAFQIGQAGLISVDYENIDYSKATIGADSDPDNYYVGINSNVQNSFKATGNVKIGGELKLGLFALRAGGGFYGNPYKSDQFNKDAKTFSYSGGFGYRDKSFFCDFAYIMIESKYKYKLYDYADQNNNGATTPELADVDSKFGRFIATFGLKF
jgi:hypothetical protein